MCVRTYLYLLVGCIVTNEMDQEKKNRHTTGFPSSKHYSSVEWSSCFKDRNSQPSTVIGRNRMLIGFFVLQQVYRHSKRKTFIFCFGLLTIYWKFNFYILEGKKMLVPECWYSVWFAIVFCSNIDNIFHQFIHSITQIYARACITQSKYVWIWRKKIGINDTAAAAKQPNDDRNTDN